MYVYLKKGFFLFELYCFENIIVHSSPIIMIHCSPWSGFPSHGSTLQRSSHMAKKISVSFWKKNFERCKHFNLCFWKKHPFLCVSFWNAFSFLMHKLKTNTMAKLTLQELFYLCQLILTGKKSCQLWRRSQFGLGLTLTVGMFETWLIEEALLSDN